MTKCKVCNSNTPHTRLSLCRPGPVPNQNRHEVPTTTNNKQMEVLENTTREYRDPTLRSKLRKLAKIRSKSKFEVKVINTEVPSLQTTAHPKEENQVSGVPLRKRKLAMSRTNSQVKDIRADADTDASRSQTAAHSNKENHGSGSPPKKRKLAMTRTKTEVIDVYAGAPSLQTVTHPEEEDAGFFGDDLALTEADMRILDDSDMDKDPQSVSDEQGTSHNALGANAQESDTVESDSQERAIESPPWDSGSEKVDETGESTPVSEEVEQGILGTPEWSENEDMSPPVSEEVEERVSGTPESAQGLGMEEQEGDSFSVFDTEWGSRPVWDGRINWAAKPEDKTEPEVDVQSGSEMRSDTETQPASQFKMVSVKVPITTKGFSLQLSFK
ncbi:hypothetical protein B0O80DRAFT_429756 [Mortierella sp. GBAus27b]|nr:hypothetical protein B0O80DRAFT_431546 [Mortierella sp. GBAus27b]KAI8348225.1 hypothetical protein B0O80DRAFT_429756 [Mortierella sp. GBAus27b]